MRNRYEIQGDTTIIFLQRGMTTAIETADLPRACEFPNQWHTHKGYVRGKMVINGKRALLDKRNGNFFGDNIKRLTLHIRHGKHSSIFGPFTTTHFDTREENPVNISRKRGEPCDSPKMQNM